MAGPNDPALGFADAAFEEEPPRRGTTRVFHGNRESASRDDPRLDVLSSQVEDLLSRVHLLESRLEELEGDLSDDPTEYDDEPPV
jgi:hypothetical protein